MSKPNYQQGLRNELWEWRWGKRPVTWLGDCLAAILAWNGWVNYDPWMMALGWLGFSLNTINVRRVQRNIWMIRGELGEIT